MVDRRDQFKSSYGAFASQQRERERDRERRDARDAADAAAANGAAGGDAAAPDAAAHPAAAAPDDGSTDTTVEMPAVVRSDVTAATRPPAGSRAEKTTVRPRGARGRPPDGAPES